MGSVSTIRRAEQISWAVPEMIAGMGLRDLRSETAAMDRGRLARAGISRREVDRLVDNGELHRYAQGQLHHQRSAGGGRRVRQASVAGRGCGPVRCWSCGGEPLLSCSAPRSAAPIRDHLELGLLTSRALVRPPLRSSRGDPTFDGIAVTSDGLGTVYDLARSEDQLCRSRSPTPRWPETHALTRTSTPSSNGQGRAAGRSWPGR